MAGLASGTGNLRAPLKDSKDDLYETPAVAVEALPQVIWEPACGPGAIVRVLRAAGHVVYATDLVDYESPDQDEAGWDFLMERKRLPMMHRAAWAGRKANSGMAFAWFVWDRSYSGPTELRRLSWESETA